MLTPPAPSLERGLNEVAALAALPGFWTLPAVQKGEVYFINHVYFTRPCVEPPALSWRAAVALMVHRKDRMDILAHSPLPLCRAELSRCAGRRGPRLVDGVEMLSRVLGPGIASCRFPPGTCFKLELSNGQRCRPRHIADHFHPIA